MAVITATGARTTGLLGGTSGVQTLSKVPLNGGRLRQVADTAELTTPDSTSTVWLARLPSNAVLVFGLSLIFWDDLASIGSPTVDIGTFNPSGRTGLTDDDNSLFDGGDLATANTTGVKLGNIDVGGANLYKYLWEHAGATSDPKQMIDIKATVQDANCNASGTFSWVIVYVID